MVIYLVPNSDKPKAKKAANQAAEILQNNGAKCVYDKALCGFEIPTAADMPQTEAIKSSDLIVTIGGDGTLLHMAAEIIDGIPMMGINVGRLGFLTELEITELEELKKLVAGNYFIEKRRMVKAYLPNDKKCYYALNEIVMCAMGAMKTITLDIKCDEGQVNSYRGDGVIVATPTGSTAYSLSAGGPIVDAAIDCLIVTPVCAHSLNTPPLVFSDKRSLSLKATETGEEEVMLFVDGRAEKKISSADEIVITLSDKCISFVRLGQNGQFKAIDQKLKRR